MKKGKPLAEFIVHQLDSAAIYPKPFRGKGTEPGWEVEERRDISIAGNSGKIVWVGSSSELGDRVAIGPQTRFINGHGLTALPGFVDSHTHLVYAGDRSNEFEMRVRGHSYLDILAKGGGILKTVEAVRNTSEDELLAVSTARIWDMIEWGVTTLEIKSGYGLDLATEIKMLKVIQCLQEAFPITIVPTFMGGHAFPKKYKENPEELVDEICDSWIPAVAGGNLAVFNDVFTENKAFNVEHSRKILETGKKYGLKPKIHADEINRIGGIDLAIEMNAVSADHLLVTENDGIAKLSRSGVIPTLLPGTSTFLMENHHAKARDMINAGLPVAIASDFNPGSCQCYAAGMIQSLAMLQLKMSAAEALIAGTLHAAFALDLGNETGAIEVGKNMDLALLNTDSYKNVGYQIGKNLINTVIAKGVPIIVRE